MSFFDDMPNPYNDLYIWDSLEKRGFPLSDHIRCIHLDREPGRRAFIAGAAPEEIEALVLDEGNELTEVMLEVLRTFTTLLFRVYQDQSADKRKEILDFIRKMGGE